MHKSTFAFRRLVAKHNVARTPCFQPCRMKSNLVLPASGSASLSLPSSYTLNHKNDATVHRKKLHINASKRVIKGQDPLASLYLPNAAYSTKQMDKESIEKALNLYAGYHLRSVTLQQLTDFGRNLNLQLAIQSTTFVQTELCVRLAHIVKELDSLPGLLLNMRPVQQVKEWYITSFRELMEFQSLDSFPTDEAKIAHMNRFNVILDKILARHAPVVMTIAQGIVDLKKVHGRKYMELPIRYFLDRIYMSRIGIRLLIGQHIEVYKTFVGENEKEDGSTLSGLVDQDCRVRDILEDAYQNAAFLCRQYYSVAPELKVYYPKEIQKFTYIPSHLYHILFELLKNSMRAVVEYHEENDEMPYIKAVIVEGEEDITIKISDEGGGIPRSDLASVNSYLYTTASPPDLDDIQRSDINHAPLAGFGYGLPLSRLYARYLGGDLQIISLEGYGTDAYVHLKATAGESSEVLPAYSSGAMRNYNSLSSHQDWQISTN